MASSDSALEPSPDVPIFLRKTYHMINSCDPDIACWSDDGETFVVKDPVKFERTIIPQFFKHSKFSSFVRQLNFYSFRKIKYCDSIRIDPKLEAETANYWRFRHEHFQRGKPVLLTEIKRMNGAKSTTPTAATASKPFAVKTEDPNVNAEVQSLKKKIQEMTHNIDSLTAMVEKVSLKQEEQETSSSDTDENVGNKRKKLETNTDEVRPDEMLSAMELDDMASVLPVAPMSMPEPVQSMPRETSTTSEVSDTTFVDQLFNAFQDEDDEVMILDAPMPPLPPTVDEDENNQPDPELMQRMGDALMLLPKEIQEMIVDRLIAAITTTDLVDQDVVAAISGESKKVIASGKAVLPVPQTPESEKKLKQEPTLPLAAATLAALLHHYNAQVQQQGKNQSPKNVQKSIPVIPVHA